MKLAEFVNLKWHIHKNDLSLFEAILEAVDDGELDMMILKNFWVSQKATEPQILTSKF